MRNYHDVVANGLEAVENIEDDELRRSIALRLLEDALVRVYPERATELPEVTEEVPAETDTWAQELADAANVTPDRVLSVLQRDEEDQIKLICGELGAGTMERLRNMTVLILWARRTVGKKDMYVPQSEVTTQISDLGVSARNLTNAVKSDNNLQQVTISRKRMLQLVGKWKDRAAAILREYPA